MSGSSPAWDAIGIFGGTFDPVHFGHLRTAFEVQVRLGLDHVRFVPCADPPHREGTSVGAATRLRMVEAAIEGKPGFVIDRREFDRAGPSYTVDTLRSMKAEFGTQTLCLILGLDAFAELHAWHDWRGIFSLAHIIVAHRPGSVRPSDTRLREILDERLAESVNDLKSASSGRIFFLEGTQLDISSTGLRASIAAGVRPDYLVPSVVWQIIREEGCYGAEA